MSAAWAHRMPRRLIPWIAGLLLLAALAPSLARLGAAERHPAASLPIWALDALCRSGGSGSPDDPLAASHGDHCPLCQLQRDLPSLPPAEAGPLRLAALPADPRPGPALHPAPTRGPPPWRQPPAHAPPAFPLV